MTRPTEAPIPGVALDAESVNLVQAGDMLWHGPSVTPVEFINQCGKLPLAIVIRKDREYEAQLSALTFIGRPDAEGWISWAGGENPVGDALVDIETYSKGPFSGQSDCMQWGTHHREYAILRFRLSRPTPVPAEAVLGAGVAFALNVRTAEAPMVTEGVREVEPDLVQWFKSWIDHYVENENGPDQEAFIACLDRVRDSYRLAALTQPQGAGE